MSGYSDALKNEILDENMPEEGWLALVTAPVTGAMTGATIAEVAYTGSGRIAMKGTDWNPAAGGKKTNSVTKAFGECTAGEDTLVGWALLDSPTPGEGNVICSGKTPPSLVDAGVIPRFVGGALVFAILDT